MGAGQVVVGSFNKPEMPSWRPILLPHLIQYFFLYVDATLPTANLQYSVLSVVERVFGW